MAGVKILVVEDHPMQSKLVSFLLEEAGHTVRTAESAEKALELLQSFHPFHPDLILMDLELPGKDGLELTRELRRHPLLDVTAIVALTAYGDPADLARAREAGCDGCIAKPIDPTSFAHQVRKYSGGGLEEWDADAQCDSADLLAQARNDFLAQGLQQCGVILKALDADPDRASQTLRRVLRRWASLGTTLGFPGIPAQARKLEALFVPGNLPLDQIRKAVETAQRRFRTATRYKPSLPLELVASLRDVRIGLVDFSEDQANRIRRAAKSAQSQVVIERMKNNSIENQTAYGALIVNECDLSSQEALHRPQWSVPAVFIGSRSSWLSFSKLPSRAYDFLIAPWDAEEVLVRVYRLFAKAAPPRARWDVRHLQKRRTRVLIADDDPDNVFLVSEVLQQSDMDCEVARSGRHALDAAQRHPPDAMVLDVNMLDLDGFEVLKKLRANEVTSEIPVLMLTARRDRMDIALGFSHGADDYMGKPFKPSELIERVNKIIAARRKSQFLHSIHAN
jgi:two-component system, cell cycle response regulator DivK